MNNIKDKDVVVKSREIAVKRVDSTLNKFQWNILYFLLNKFNDKYWDFNLDMFKKSDEYFLDFRFNDFKNKFSYKNNYRNFLDSFEKVFDFKYIDENENNITFLHLFSHTEINKKDLYFKVFLNKRMINHVLNVNDNFILLELSNVKKFKCKYTIPFYDYIKARSSKKINIIITIDDFKKQLNITKYDLFSDLKRFVIDSILKDLKNTDLNKLQIEYLKGFGNKFEKIKITN